jgi:hexulose-6-phosphate isomerase
MRVDPWGRPAISRREAMRTSLVGSGTVAAATLAGPTEAATLPDDRHGSPRRYDMKTSINLWAFPYPDRMSLHECLKLAKAAGFDGIELNYDLENDLSPGHASDHYRSIREEAAEIGIAISGLCSFLFWPYALTDNDLARRSRGLELARGMLHAAHDLGTENVLIVPGAVAIPWRVDHTPVPNDVCDRRAKEAVAQLIPLAQELGVFLNIENIFFNGYLLSPAEMNAFVDSFHSDRVRIHFDTGNIMEYQYPEHWIPQLGHRIKNIHFKEWNKKATDHSLESFRLLLDGSTNWPAVMAALEAIDYRGYLTFEYFHPFAHYPEAIVFQASDALDRMLGRKA